MDVDHELARSDSYIMKLLFKENGAPTFDIELRNKIVIGCHGWSTVPITVCSKFKYVLCLGSYTSAQ